MDFRIQNGTVPYRGAGFRTKRFITPRSRPRSRPRHRHRPHPCPNPETCTRNNQIVMFHLVLTVPIPATARFKAWVCGRSLAGVTGSNTTRDMDVCLFWILCVVRWRSLREADPSSRGVLQCVCVCVSLSVISCNNDLLHLQWVGRIAWTNKILVALNSLCALDTFQSVLQSLFWHYIEAYVLLHVTHLTVLLHVTHLTPAPPLLFHLYFLFQPTMHNIYIYIYIYIWIIATIFILQSSLHVSIHPQGVPKLCIVKVKH